MHPPARYASVALIVAIALGAAAPPAEAAAGWETFTVTWEAETDKGPQKITQRMRIPADMKDDEPIRGVMARVRGLDEFAHRNRIAVFEIDYLRGGLGGTSQPMLDAAAEAAGRPELKHAGCILQGLSVKGRVRAHFAYFNPERTIAVLLDHSWTPRGPSMNVSEYAYGQLPAGKGVPYFFAATRSNKHQGFDRRALHYSWCTAALRRLGHPCTTVIEHTEAGHGGAGPRALQAIWLEEVMAMRVPSNIPTDGKPYKLRPVYANKGGLVKAQLATDGGRTYHTSVSIGPASRNVGSFNWWVPGPRTAKGCIEFIEKNGGKIRKDASDRIAAPVAK